MSVFHVNINGYHEIGGDRHWQRIENFFKHFIGIILSQSVVLLKIGFIRASWSDVAYKRIAERATEL
ncbi:hypothetical protein F5B22DRAFT_649700 [Xylaria bambusicola]|uniref:uncharacterized protein n=1 Tax=Xylaria bambusicola TaxID=326684 RepID=UPI0020074EEB|nr:uncharacterized protein F5B22DRAFT_649700 [Xylaria bambusicola]KAI0508804.1 hypothetical protein F5B22DRAFT_649700 [Xylaria bambusicola]